MLVACSDAPPMPPKVVEVEHVQLAPFRFSVSLVGVIKPKYESVLTARVTGAVDTHIKAGDVVKKGDIIAEIQKADTQKNYDLAMKEAAIAKEQFERAQTLGHSKTMSKQDVEGKRIEMIRAEKQALDAKNRLEDSQFIAPFDDCIVGVYKVREGAHMNVGDVLVTVYKKGELVVTFDIPEEFMAKVNAQQHVIIGGKPFTLTGVQKLIDPESHMGPAFVNYTCDACVVGSNVNVDLVMYDGEKDISVPKEAVYYTPDQAFVYLVKDGKAALQPVKVGYTYKERTQIVEGLKTSDAVVAKGITRLFPGLDVVIFEDKSDTKVASALDKTAVADKK
ncbi:MAG: efflux RND transporter periplasmic adaptor subunit [Alphaproteobacteria bacterium]|nr:efflux RND transporter periplasmic adaptor subunit [Alphaproteobacteria bacterium]